MVNSSLDAYRTHDLNIQMQTSSGDKISLDFSNKQALSMQHSENAKGGSDALSFSSMQSYSFKVESNGITEQDEKEIEAFMQIAQPYIDNFMQELSDGDQSSPRGQIAKALDDIFEPLKLQDQNHQNYAKNEIVNLFDTAASQIEEFDKIFQESQKLLDNILKLFDKVEKDIYA